MSKYKVYWDNGREACGTFSLVYDSYEDAEAFAENWANEMNAMDGISNDDEDGYSYDIIEILEVKCSVCGLYPAESPVYDEENKLAACSECADGVAEQNDNRGKLNHRGQP